MPQPPSAAMAIPPQRQLCGSQTPIRGEIDFRHLTFTYPTARTEDGTSSGPVLHDINLHIPAGSTLAIVGPTGSGKSTLASLIARLWDAPPGYPLHRRPLDSRLSRHRIAPRHRLRSAGHISFQRHVARKHRVRRQRPAMEEQIYEAAEIASVSGEIQSFPQRLRHDGGRARHHAFRRTETAHVASRARFCASRKS